MLPVLGGPVDGAAPDPTSWIGQVMRVPGEPVEVSLLSDPEYLEFAGEEALLAQLRPGEDGLIIFSGCRSATFLPQVWEQLPEPHQFLAALKRKAGLPTHRETAGLMAARYHVRKWKETEQEAS